MRRWFKMFMRRRMSPIAVPRAHRTKGNLSMAYMFFAWNATGLMIYQMMKEGYPMTEQEKKQPGHYYARLMQSENVQVIQVDGFTVSNKYTVPGKPDVIPSQEEFEQEYNPQDVY